MCVGGGGGVRGGGDLYYQVKARKDLTNYLYLPHNPSQATHVADEAFPQITGEPSSIIQLAAWEKRIAGQYFTSSCFRTSAVKLACEEAGVPHDLMGRHF